MNNATAACHCMDGSKVCSAALLHVMSKLEYLQEVFCPLLTIITQQLLFL